MFGWLQKNVLLAVIIGGLTAAVAIEGGLLLNAQERKGELKAEVKSVGGQRDELKLQNTSLAAAQKTLTAAHEKCLSEVKVSQTEQAVSSQQIATLVKKVETSGALVRSYRDKIYLEPNCDALQKFDLATACPALAGSLRNRARQLSSTTGPD